MPTSLPAASSGGAKHIGAVVGPVPAVEIADSGDDGSHDDSSDGSSSESSESEVAKKDPVSEKKPEKKDKGVNEKCGEDDESAGVEENAEEEFDPHADDPCLSAEEGGDVGLWLGVGNKEEKDETVDKESGETGTKKLEEDDKEEG